MVHIENLTGDVKMYKAKIFTSGTTDTFDELESEVNEWLAELGEGVEIISHHVTGAAGTNIVGAGFVNCTIAIFYKLKE